MAILDLDGLGRINERFGYRQGDKVLQAAANGLRAAAGDVISLARLGGDEFCLLMVVTGWDDVQTRLERLRADVCESVNAFKVTVSLGYSVRKIGESRSPEAWFDEIDKALLAAKSAGGNRCHAAQ